MGKDESITEEKLNCIASPWCKVSDKAPKNCQKEADSAYIGEEVNILQQFDMEELSFIVCHDAGDQSRDNHNDGEEADCNEDFGNFHA